VIRGLHSEVNGRLSRLLAPREIILRSEGRVRYLRLSTTTQAILFGTIALVSASAVATSIGMAVQQLSLRDREIALRRSDNAYTRLLTDVTGYFDQFSKGENSSAADEANLLGLAPADSSARQKLQALSSETAGPPNQIDALERGKLQDQLREALRQKLHSLNDDLRRIAVRNQALDRQVAELKSSVALADNQRDRSAVLRSAVARALASKQIESQSLVAQVDNLIAEVGDLNTQVAAANAQSSTLNATVASLHDQMSNLGGVNADLQRQVGQTQRALATIVAQRNTLQVARTDMAGSIDDLRQRLTSIQESQASFVSHLTERARQNLSDMEKTVQMTGLNVDRLLRLTNEQFSGEGGPFIPAPTDTKDTNERKLLESVATLDDEVGRWEKLQVILRSLPLSAPVDHYYISSGFGERTDPFNGETAIHEGVDMVDAIRSDVLATAPGKVIFAGWKGGYGRCVEIDHGLGIHTLYGHLDSILVKVGDLVDYRQTIAKLGSSGRSSGPHVHYEIRFENHPLDPMGFLKAGRYVFKG
jgi:murein DD-endopeptidase MepM/ murein hydrolase activator NlpD